MTDNAPCPPSRPTALAVTVHAAGASVIVPPAIARAGEHAARMTLEFFTARIANPNTRRAYGRAVAEFCAWLRGP